MHLLNTDVNESKASNFSDFISLLGTRSAPELNVGRKSSMARATSSGVHVVMSHRGQSRPQRSFEGGNHKKYVENEIKIYSAQKLGLIDAIW